MRSLSKCAACVTVEQVGVMVFSTLFAAAVWREKPGRLGMIGIGIACVAVTLLNLS